MELVEFVKKDYLLVISAILAVISLFIVPFDTVLNYEYMRIMKTICILLCFLLIVAGLKECKALNLLAHKALSNIKTTTGLCLVLIALPFFCAMLFSNDVAVLTFVPLALATIGIANTKWLLALVVVLQSVAANVGSFLTPFGNPHNLYIYSLHDYYGFSLWEYEMALIPIVVVGITVLTAIAFLLPKKDLPMNLEKDVELEHKGCLWIIGALMVISIATVLDFIPFYISIVILIVTFLIMMPKVFRKVDYSILFIFFFLFIFANGITSLEIIYDTLKNLISIDPMLTTVLVSQFTSNVPSTILLQPFTDNWEAIVVGADIGGFGTPIASMVNIIAIKLYLSEEGTTIRGYLKPFIAINLLMLAVLIPTYYIF